MSSEVNPYQVSREKEAELTCELLEERPPSNLNKLSRFVCYQFEGTEKYTDLGRSVEGDVFNKYFNDSPKDMQEGYKPYEKESVFFVSVDRKKKMAVGVLRAIRYGENGFKTLNDLSHIITEEEVMDFHNVENMEDCYDIGTIAVRKEYRGKLTPASQLYRSVHLSAHRENIKHYVTALDERAYERLTDYAGAPFRPLVNLKPIPYMGSHKTQPAFMHLDEIMASGMKNLPTPKGIIGSRVSIPLMFGTLDHTLYREPNDKH